MSKFNQWFIGLPEGRQAVLRDDKWMLAENAYEAGKESSTLTDSCFIDMWVTVDHPTTYLNPNKWFKITEVSIEGNPMEHKIMIRGENTYWFNSKSILDWSDVNPEN